MRLHHVDDDALARHFLGQVLGKVGKRRIAQALRQGRARHRHLAGAEHAAGGGAANANDAPAAGPPHVLERGARAADRAQHLAHQADHHLIIARSFQRGGRRIHHGRGIVDQHVESAEGLRRSVYRPAAIVRPRQVGGNSDAPATLGPHLGRHLRERRLIARADADVGALGREGQGERRPRPRLAPAISATAPASCKSVAGSEVIAPTPSWRPGRIATGALPALSGGVRMTDSTRGARSRARGWSNSLSTRWAVGDGAIGRHESRRDRVGTATARSRTLASVSGPALRRSEADRRRRCRGGQRPRLASS